MTQFSVRTLEVDGRPTLVTQGGAGPPLLYLHGLADVHSALDPAGVPSFLSALGASFQVVAPAHPGYAGSDGREVDDVEDVCFHYADLLDALGLDRVHLAGHSLGGWLAAEFAIRHPARVRSLVLISALGLHLPGSQPALFFGAAAPRGVGGFGEVRTVLFSEPDGPLALTVIPDDMDRDRQLRWFGGLAGAARLGWRGPQLASPKLLSRLRRIQAPTLLLWGDSDRLAPVAHADAFAAGIPGARLVTIEGGGHCLVLEHPDRCADEAVRFLESS